MEKIIIYFPQIIFEQKEIEVTEEQADDLLLHHIDIVNFIWNNLTDSEQDFTSQKMIDDFYDSGTIKMIKRKNKPEILKGKIS